MTSFLSEATTTIVGLFFTISSAKEGPDNTQKLIESPNVDLTISETNFRLETTIPIKIIKKIASVLNAF